MIVHPRSAWTSVNPQGSAVDLADEVDGLPNFSPEDVKGVSIHYGGTNYEIAKIDPRNHFEAIRRNDMVNKRYSDIMYCLGVNGYEEGVWTLRGLINKGAANGGWNWKTNQPSADAARLNNAQYIPIYCQVGVPDQPTDLLFDNLRDARNLVLAKYPNGTDVKPHKVFRPTACPGDPIMEVCFNKDGSPKKTFWNKEVVTPPVDYVCPLPLPTLREGDNGIKVVDLQNQLGFWGYYHANVDGVYGAITKWCVAVLQNDLKRMGYYPYIVDGVFGPKTYEGWCQHLEAMWGLVNP